MFKTSLNIIVLKELLEYLLPLSDEEFSLLQESIILNGCKDSLVVWEKQASEFVLIDGHNRYKICQENGIAFEVTKLKFSDLEEVKAWMIDNQLGRRNLNPDQLSYYRGLKYLSLKKTKGGYENVKSKGQNELSTTEVLANQFKVSESTIKRDSKYAEGLEIIGQSNPKLKTSILLGEIKIKKSDIQILPEFKNTARVVIKNEADLLNKAKLLKDQILDEVEKSITNIETKRKEDLSVQIKEPIFLERQDRLIKIKGMILAAINRAINDRNVEAIYELRKLIERLEHELFD